VRSGTSKKNDLGERDVYTFNQIVKDLENANCVVFVPGLQTVVDNTNHGGDGLTEHVLNWARNEVVSKEIERRKKKLTISSSVVKKPAMSSRHLVERDVRIR